MIAHNAIYANVAPYLTDSQHGFIKVTKHDDVETVKTCLIKHRIKLHTKRTMGHKLTRVTFSPRDFSMADRETSKVVIQRFKLKKSIETIILLEVLEEDGKKRIKVDERRPGAG